MFVYMYLYLHTHMHTNTHRNLGFGLPSETGHPAELIRNKYAQLKQENRFCLFVRI